MPVVALTAETKIDPGQFRPLVFTCTDMMEFTFI
jgi:hypothetical protein